MSTPHLANRAFDVILRDGERISVAAGTSIIDALEAASVIVPSVCREGICGTCETPVISGDIDHRDQIMSDDEKKHAKTMMLCVSRCRSDELVLDL